VWAAGASPLLRPPTDHRNCTLIDLNDAMHRRGRASAIYEYLSAAAAADDMRAVASALVA
jgi:hypothetical protein